MEVGWAHACQSRVTVPCRISKPHPHLATCLLPGPGFQGPLSANYSQGPRQVSSWGEGKRDGRFTVPPASSIWSVPMATLACEAPWLPLHQTLEMTLGQPCCCSSWPISPRHVIVLPPLGICRTHLNRIASNSEVFKASTKAQRHPALPLKATHRVSLQKRLQAPFKIRRAPGTPPAPAGQIALAS